MTRTGLFADPRMRFLLAGGSAALVNWLVRFPLGLFMPFAAAVLVALAIGMAYGFFIYRRWVFGSSGSRPLLAEIRDFLLVNAAGAIVTVATALAVRAIPHGLGLPDALAEGGAHATGIAAGALVNYIGHKRLTFRA